MHLQKHREPAALSKGRLARRRGMLSLKTLSELDRALVIALDLPSF